MQYPFDMKIKTVNGQRSVKRTVTHIAAQYVETVYDGWYILNQQKGYVPVSRDSRALQYALKTGSSWYPSTENE